jgi:putative redox protein
MPSLYDDPTVTAVTGASGFRTDVRARGFTLVADEPASGGGTEAGPTPYDLLAAALASCTSMTLRMYADRKRWPLKRVAVHVAHARLHADDCATCETEEGHIDRLTRRIEVVGPLTDEQRARLLQIADRCPVHRTLHGEIDVLTEMASADPATLS